jgi:hypothetical protein
MKSIFKMKKYILSGIAVLAVATVVALNVSLNSQSEELSDLSLANVEALANGESFEEVLCSAWCQIYLGYECNVMTPSWWLRCVDYNKK